MEHDQEFDLAEMSGESSYRTTRLMELNEVTLNGDGDAKEVSPGQFKRTGGYFRKRVLVGHKRDSGKPEEIELGQNIAVVFLKIRRKLEERGNEGEIVRSTNEHNHKSEVVTLYDSRNDNQQFVGKASDIRETYEGLRTVQIVYALLKNGGGEPELVKIRIKGSSLGSEAKAEGVMNFYQYIASFAKGEHIWEYKTILSPVLEEGKKSYFSIKFERGEKLSDPELQFAIAKLKEVHTNCVEVDSGRAAKMATISVDPVEDDEPAAPVEVPKPAWDASTGEVNPDDIPF